MKRKRTLEPYDARALRKFLESRGAVQFVGTATQHARYRMPDGVEVPCPGKGPVTLLLAKDVAGRLGMSYSELRVAMGHPQMRRSSKKTSPRAKTPATKSAVLAAVSDLRAQLTAIDTLVRPGVHDEAFYRRILTNLSVARRALSDEMTEAASSTRSSSTTAG